MVAANYFPEYLRARISFGLMSKLINEKPHIDSMTNRGKTPVWNFIKLIVNFFKTIEGHIEFKGVDFAYPNNIENLVLKDFHLEAEQRTNLGLIGLTGSGKSTAIQLLERYYDVLSGNIVSIYTIFQ